MEFPKHELLLRVWIGIVAFMALGNTFAVFFGTPTFLKSRLYNANPDELTPLASRLFGCWTLLASIIRGYCCLHLRNKVLYDATLITFVVAFMHFITELFAYNTCLLEFGVISPLVISGVSFLWMFIAQWFIEFDQAAPRPITTKPSRRKKQN